jgi:hypothetical protein
VAAGGETLNTPTKPWRKYTFAEQALATSPSYRLIYVSRHFALVSTYTNAAGELVSERLVREPYTFDESKIPPMPTGHPPRSYEPFPWPPKYHAYVPKKADPRLPYIPIEDRVHVQEHTCGSVCEKCRISEQYARAKRVVEAEEPKGVRVRPSKKRMKKRKPDRSLDSSNDMHGEEAVDEPWVEH